MAIDGRANWLTGASAALAAQLATRSACQFAYRRPLAYHSNCAAKAPYQRPLPLAANLIGRRAAFPAPLVAPSSSSYWARQFI